MNCTVCGTALADGTRFCPSCGAPQYAQSQPTSEAGQPQHVTPQSAAQQPVYITPQSPVAQTPGSGTKKKHTLPVVLIIAAVLLVAAVIAAAAPKLWNKSPEPAGPTPEAVSETTYPAELTTAVGETSASAQTTGVLPGGEEASQTASAQENLSESCDYFSLLLPSAWEGRYTCERYPDALYFYHKKAQAENDGSYDPLLFSIWLTEIPTVPEELDPEWDGTDEVCILSVNGTDHLVRFRENGASLFAPQYINELTEMMSYFQDVGARISPKGNASVVMFDYSSLLKTYSGTAANGDTISLTLDRAALNCVYGTMTVTSGDGLSSVQAECMARLFGDVGTVDWMDGGGAFSGKHGNGYVRIDGRSLWLELSCAYDDWPNTDGYVELK